MTSLKDLKKQSEAMLAKIKQTNEGEGSTDSGGRDPRIWTPTFDKEKGSGFAVVRFLPPVSGEDLPFQQVYMHQFKGPTGKWYVEKSLSTLKKTDCVGDMNRRLYNSGVESDKKVASSMKRRCLYYANVLVLEDPANPESVGQVKIFQFGPQIHEILQEKMFPTTDFDKPMNPFDPWSGADFEIRIVRNQMKLPEYKRSTFRSASVIGDDDKIEAIWAKCHPLKPFVDPSSFKTNEELKARLIEVLGSSVGSGIATVEGMESIPQPVPQRAPKSATPKTSPVVEDDGDDSAPWDEPAAPAPKASKPVADTTTDDDLDFFSSL